MLLFITPYDLAVVMTRKDQRKVREPLDVVWHLCVVQYLQAGGPPEALLERLSKQMCEEQKGQESPTEPLS